MGTRAKKILAQTLRDAIRRKDLGQRETARRAKISPAYLNNLLSTKRGNNTGRVGAAVASRLAEVLDLPIEVFFGSEQHDTRLEVIGELEFHSDRIKLYVDSVDNADTRVELIARPSWLADPDAFCFRVIEASYTKRYRAGDYIIAESTDELENGDDAVVELNVGELYLKVFWQQADGTVTLESINSVTPPLVLKAPNIKLHRVSAIIRKRRDPLL